MVAFIRLEEYRVEPVVAQKWAIRERFRGDQIVCAFEPSLIVYIVSKR